MAELCHMDMESFIVHEKSGDMYADLAGYVKKRFDASNYEVKRPTPTRKKQKRNQTDERWLRWRNNERIVALRPKSYSYLTKK